MNDLMHLQSNILYHYLMLFQDAIGPSAPFGLGARCTCIGCLCSASCNDGRPWDDILAQSSVYVDLQAWIARLVSAWKLDCSWAIAAAARDGQLICQTSNANLARNM